MNVLDHTSRNVTINLNIKKQVQKLKIKSTLKILEVQYLEIRPTSKYEKLVVVTGTF